MRPYAFGLLLFSAALLGALPYIAAPPAASQPVLPSAPYSQSQSVSATIYNVFLFIALVAAATVAVYFAIRFKRIFRAFIAAAWFMIVWGVSWAYAIKYYSCGLLPDWAAAALVYAPLALGPAVVLAVFKRRGDVAIAFLSALAGTMLVWMLPPPTVLALMVALPIYDLFMVYKGLLGRLIKKARGEVGRPDAPRGEPPLFGLMAKVGDLSVGTGDFFAYSMALTTIGVKYSALGPLAAAGFMALGLALIYVGFKLTAELLLKRRGYAPALPIPMALVLPLILL